VKKKPAKPKKKRNAELEAERPDYRDFDFTVDKQLHDAIKFVEARLKNMTDKEVQLLINAIERDLH
jgi:hypothetical protein